MCSEMSKGKLPVLLSGESNIQDRSVDASLHPGATNLGGSARNPTGQTHRSAREPPPERLSSITSGVARGQLPPPTFAPLRPTEGEHSHQQIPPVQELTALNDRIHAPNLTTYIHHVRKSAAPPQRPFVDVSQRAASVCVCMCVCACVRVSVCLPLCLSVCLTLWWTWGNFLPLHGLFLRHDLRSRGRQLHVSRKLYDLPGRRGSARWEAGDLCRTWNLWILSHRTQMGTGT